MLSVINFKKTFGVLAILLLVGVTFGPITAPAAHAAANAATAAAGQAQKDCLSNGGSTQSCDQVATAAGAAAGTSNGKCSWFGDWDICFSNVIYFFFVGLGSSLAYMAAYIFDIAAQLSLNGTAYALDFLSSGWTLVRDIANMSFIFILIYIALNIMFDSDTTNMIRTLAWVVIVALLVNFSFFFTRVAIDAGNIVAVQFYNAIPTPTTVGSACVFSSLCAGNGATTKDLTGSIMGAIGVQTLINNDSFSKYTSGGKLSSDWFTNMIGLSFLYICVGAIFWILFITFLSTGFKFIVRVAVLWFVLVVSPLAFVARTMSKTRPYYDTWQDLLIKHSIYPAVFLFIFLLLTKFTVAMGGPGSTAIANALTSANVDQSSGFVAGMAQIIGNIGIRVGIIVIILYYGSKVADKLGVMGGELGRTIAAGGFGLTGQLVGGGLGLLGRNTLGRIGSGVANGLDDKTKQGGFRGTLWTGVQKGAKRVGKGTYDVRNAPGYTPTKNFVQKIVGATVDTGKGTSKNIYDIHKAKADDAEKHRKAHAAEVRDKSNEEALKRLSENVYAATPAGTAEKKADEDRIRNFGKRELEGLKAENAEKIAHLLKESQSKIVKDGPLTEDEKDTVSAITDPIVKAQKIVADELRKLPNVLRTVATPLVSAGTVRGQMIDSAQVNAMLTEVNDHIDNLNPLITNPGALPPNVDIDDLKFDKQQLIEARVNLNKLNGALNNVPAHAGGNGAANTITAL